MKILALIPSVLKQDIAQAVEQDAHPRMDYYALADALMQPRDGRGQNEVTLLDYGALEERNGVAPPAIVRIVRRLMGRDAALATLGVLRCRDVDALFTNGENV